MVTTDELNDRREEGCWRVLHDKKYYHIGNSCIKRTLRRHEWPTNSSGDIFIPPRAYPQRFKNDGAVLHYLSQNTTDIPLPRLQCAFEDDGAFYHLTEYVPGESMKDLAETDKKVVEKELLKHLETLHSLRSDTPGIPGETLLCPPQRVFGGWKKDSCWRLKKDAPKGEYVLCHNDLGQHNIIVDTDTLKINAIIDWEFGGFWPEWFEKPYYERVGPSVALEGEEDDAERCREWLLEYCDEVVMPSLDCSTYRAQVS